ncbi:pyridoxamine 5'-phosphate oxidase family protein [Natronococcus sp. A-GB1]|uniref:pyridoxamine 5'-phosphate oxidase family protein n=1 Tax=Natronococcus sp. A-GB1 TaxID=3037648 RepID=UPI00241DB889|nr:pyridoxamine 5'-phosphate oxidase family protein [Natronococcus sp. A-GB1]MDG5760034.1 pyridoxamine 5'-phosphate oxidase family protein [Natronococcus sp. A-GB1]
MKVRGSLSHTDVTTFLDERTVPIRLGCRTPADHPWMVSLWYRRRLLEAGPTDTEGDEADRESGEAGESDRWILECATAASADVVTYLRETPEVSFEVSTNDPPYAGVRGRGTASLEPDPKKEVLRDLLERYLGGTDSELAQTLLREDREEVTIAIEPAVVYGWDFSDRM